MWVFEEKYLQTYLLSPLHLVGLEGFVGAALGVMVLLWTQQTGYESGSEALYALRSSTEIQVGCIFMMLSMAVCASAGVAITREASLAIAAELETERLRTSYVLSLKDDAVLEASSLREQLQWMKAHLWKMIRQA